MLSPVVRKLLAENNLDAANIKGTGAGGRITRADVLGAMDAGAKGAHAGARPRRSPSCRADGPTCRRQSRAGRRARGESRRARPRRAGERDTAIPFSNIRRRTAEHMVRSLSTSAHTLVVIEVDYENVEIVRQAEKDEFKAAEGVSLSYLPFIARALVDAIREFPHVNATVGADELIVHNYVNLGIAVDLNFEGLIVPVVHDADTKRLRALAREMGELANKARNKKLGADDISGGTFTITNAGGYGTLITGPIINQPQVAILSTDGVKPQPVAVPLPDGTHAIAVHHVGNLAISFDHRGTTGPTRRRSWPASARSSRPATGPPSSRERSLRRLRCSRPGPQPRPPPLTWGPSLRSPHVGPLRTRWLGRVAYTEAHELMRAMWERDTGDALLLVEHPPTYTLGVRTDPANILVAPESVGAVCVRTDRGGDVTFHGPGQLVGYPVLNVAMGTNAIPNHVEWIEQLVIDALGDVGVAKPSRLEGYPGVWVDVDRDPRKIAAIGVRVSRGRSMHGFAVNVNTDLSWFDHIVPCGIAKYPVTSIANEGVKASMRDLVDAIVARTGSGDRADVAWVKRPDDLSPFSRAHAEGNAAPVRLLGRLNAAGVDTTTSVAVDQRKPEWLRVKADFSAEYRSLKQTMRSNQLVTVCEEAGCPNIYDCWNEGTATFMINGSRCTRACGFCLVDTRKPEPIDAQEPARVAAATVELDLKHVVITTVARDDLDDGGATAFAATVDAVRLAAPSTTIELLISDCKGDPSSLATIFGARPDILNHNLETVARLQRAVRPSAGYARSLSVLAQAKKTGLVTKSGLMVGLGETHDEVLGALRDLRAVGVDIATIGQYLRPTAHHLPVARWWTPDEFDALRHDAQQLGFAHVECSPLTRSSYHARTGADAALATSR